MRSVLLALAVLALGAPLAAAVPDPLVALGGELRGEGRYKPLLKGARPYAITSRGRVIGGDTLVLEQTRSAENAPARARSWRLRRDSPGYYSGSMSEAAGPVTASADGDALRVEYTLRDGREVLELWTLAESEFRSHGVVRRLGVVAGEFDERLSR